MGDRVVHATTCASVMGNARCSCGTLTSESPWSENARLRLENERLGRALAQYSESQANDEKRIDGLRLEAAALRDCNRQAEAKLGVAQARCACHADNAERTLVELRGAKEKLARAERWLRDVCQHLENATIL